MDMEMSKKIQSCLKPVVVCIVLALLQSCAYKTPLSLFENTHRGNEDISGWENVRWGMSVEEVNRLYNLKGDFRPDNGLFEPGFKQVDGHFYKSHTIGSPQYFDNLPMLVSFYFDNNDASGKLVRVKVTMMSEFGKVDFEQTSIAGFFRFIIKKHGWPYQYYPIKEEEKTHYNWRAHSGMIQSRYTKMKINNGQWSHLFTVNCLSKDHPSFSSRYKRK